MFEAGVLSLAKMHNFNTCSADTWHALQLRMQRWIQMRFIHLILFHLIYLFLKMSLE